MANRSRWFLETTLHPHILAVWRCFTISRLQNCTESTVQTSSPMDHTFKRASLECDHHPANHWFPCSHLGRQPQNFRGITGFTDCCLTYQGDDPRSQDLDFRWKIFWDVVWKSLLGYIVLAEMWLATESYFGLGAVAVRPPPSAGSPTKKSTSAPS